MTRNTASLSLDLDNLWSYMKTHGNPRWQDFPSYLDIVVPRFLSLLDTVGVKITVFVVGQDAVLPENHRALRSIAEAGHEIGNHSFHHEPWLHLYSREEIEAEIERAEDAIFAVTGVRTRGFRGPGYSLSETVLRVLQRRGYDYDCSTFPTLVGPLARAYYFMRARLESEQKEKRKALFGSLTDGLRPNAPYRWNLSGERLLEIPVTTMPGLKIPIHYSYLHWMAGASEGVASGYHTAALRVCDMAGIAPSLLLHPLDFMGHDDVAELAFFPAMNQTSSVKMNRMQRLLSDLAARYEVEPMGAHAARLRGADLRVRRPDFRAVEDNEVRSVHEAVARR
jgi:peptidoglycan-N-acetylglucosamine deacetylase